MFKQRYAWLVGVIGMSLASGACTSAIATGDADAYTAAKLKTIFLTNANRDASAQFLGVPYSAGTLVGSVNVPERLVVNFSDVDCFTFVDYVEALKRSRNQADFIPNLTAVRYLNGVVAFSSRRHFFSEWTMGQRPVAVDLTREISGAAVSVEKLLNQDEHGLAIVQGAPVIRKVVNYIPSKSVSATVVKRLRTGDYIGIYSSRLGLDVSHVGIFVMTKAGPVFRNASSRKEVMRVIDSPFISYVQDKPGIVVFRSTESY